MPCTDVTEVLQVRLDADDRVVSYELSKRTCGRAVGEASLLADWAAGQTAAHLAAVDLDAFLHGRTFPSEEEEYLAFKHFFALRLGMGVYVGEIAGRASDPCSIARLAYGEDETDFEAEIDVQILTDRIKSCGRCSGCGTKKQAPAR